MGLLWRTVVVRLAATPVIKEVEVHGERISCPSGHAGKRLGKRLRGSPVTAESCSASIGRFER